MKISVDEQNEGIRADSYLADIMQDFSRSKIQKLIKENLVTVNGKSVKASYILKDNDLIVIEDNLINEKNKILPENIPLDIVWEDDNMAVINKPSGMLTHPTVNETSGTLVNALMYKYKDALSDINGDMRKGILHRLDRNTFPIFNII